MSEIVEVGERDNGKQVELGLRQKLRVTLPEVRTSGFRWILRNAGQQALTLVTDEFEPAHAGAGGAASHSWEFRAEEIATAELTFDYGRPWERAAGAARSFSVSVRIS